MYSKPQMEQLRVKTGIVWHSTTGGVKEKTQSSPTALDQVKFTDIPLLHYTSGASGE